MSQPNLLELEAPIKICGEMMLVEGCSQQHLMPHGIHRLLLPAPALPALPSSVLMQLSQETFMGSTQICCGCLSTVASRRRLIICSSATMWTVESRAWKQSACCWPTRLVPRLA